MTGAPRSGWPTIGRAIGKRFSSDQPGVALRRGAHPTLADISRHFAPIAAVLLARGRHERYEFARDAADVVRTLARSRAAESGPLRSRSISGSMWIVVVVRSRRQP